MLALALMVLSGSPDGGHEVLALLDRQAAAWSRGDVVAFCAAYAEDAVFVSPSGVTKGKAEVLARYQKKYPTPEAMGQLSLEPIDVRVTAEAVSVAARWTLRYPQKPAVSGHTVVVFRKIGNGWLIVQDASM